MDCRTPSIAKLAIPETMHGLNTGDLVKYIMMCYASSEAAKRVRFTGAFQYGAHFLFKAN